ncbi:MAG: hypothetical protein ACRD2L_10845, partial [Terriglobia bacterium]
MKNAARFFFVGLFAVLVFQFPPALAFHEPGHIPPTGTCREPSCMEPQKDDENKGKEKEPQNEKKKKCDATKAWEEYERDLKIVIGLWEDAEEDGDRALEEFNEAGEEILSELGVGGGAKIAEETVPKITEHVLHKTGVAKGLLTELPPVAEGVTAGVGVVVPFLEGCAAVYNLNVVTNNLDYATRSQAKMYARADEKWKQVLADLERAKAEDKKCEDENKALDEKVKAEQELEKAARRYMEQGGLITPDGRVIDVYYVGNKDFRDADAALEAAKQLVTRRRQSGYLERQFVLRRVVFVESEIFAEAYVMTREEAKEAIRQI